MSVVEEHPVNMPTYRDIVRKLKGVAVERGEWAGLPMTISGLDLVLEPRFPYRLDTIKTVTEDRYDGRYDDHKVVNSWFSERLRCNVSIIKDPQGKAIFGYQLHNPVDFILGTIGASQAWLLEAERAAVDKLGELVKHHTFTHYMMTGAFMETSKRSGVIYVFRRLRPTVALKPQANGNIKILCALCLHPVGYYAGTWAGCQTPTDDVVAHLLMMRGDEAKFWANANQHDAKNPASGI